MGQVRGNRVITGAVLGALPLLLATGCSFSFGGPGAVEAAVVAERSSEMLAEQVGQTPDDFTCADDLPAEVGAEIRCELTSGGETIGATVTVTSVEGNDVQWDVVVDDQVASDGAADDTAAEDSGAGEPAAGGQPSGGGGTTAAAVDGTVPADEVAQKSSDALAEVVGQAPEDLTCSQGLPAQVGAEIRCNLVDGGMNYGVTVTTTVVDGANVQWDIQVDDAPL
ncbi:DUF4333 domain-containing protein [Nocardiopsis flavescens]|uniref:DUF4333 domain-containing protein n=1 Tax=Nocardiopsis flavescens TaxID=758803 RepID=UPI00364B120D